MHSSKKKCVFNLSNSFLLFFKVYQEFDRLLEDQSPIEAYIEWLDSMVERCVVRVRDFPFVDLC